MPTIRSITLTLLLATFSLPVLAAPRVVADITPVHSLVAQVMAGVGEPALVIQRGASPHSYALRPSEAAALERADVVFWMGEELTPWLDGALGNLAADAEQVALLHAPETIRYAFRDRVLNEATGHHDGDEHDHGHDEHDHHEHDHHDHHDQHDDHDDHGHDTHAQHDHAHDGVDPHAWLDPVNARYWLSVIATTLAAQDPANADQYQANAAAAQADIDTLINQTGQALSPVADVPFIVFHDAYQYLERRFELNTVGAISLSDARDPSPSHIADIRAIVAEEQARCVFAEPQFNPDLVETVLNGTQAQTGVIDPLGSDIATGPDFYANWMRAMTKSLLDCLGSS